jgi:hypothetical protein
MATAVRDDLSQRVELPAPLVEQLHEAEQRVRRLDLTRGLLVLLAGSLAFLLLVVLLDRRFDLSLGSRRLALLGYLVGAGLYGTFFVLRPLRAPVNPRYLARLLERTVPRARNRVLNGVELQNQQLPQAIRHAVAEQAVGVLEEVEPDRAFRDRRILWLGGTSGLLGALVVVLAFTLGLRPFGAFLGRTFLPFGFSSTIPARTQVAILQPVGGNATMTLGNPVTIVAGIEGRIPGRRDPDAPRLLFRASPEEPWRERRLSSDESGREYAVTLPPADVGQGFFYQVTAGDGRSPEYQIKARSAPNLREWSVLSHYPTYTGWPDRIGDSRKLEELRGTELTIRVTANRPLQDIRLEFSYADERTRLVSGRIDPDDPTRATLRWTLDESGRYRVRFTSREGEGYLDANPGEMVAVPDHPPRVSITQPAPEISSPPDSLVEIHGEASDDVGVQGITLHAQVVGGPRVKSQPYRSAEQIRLPHGGYPTHLDYLGFLDLGRLQTEEGQSIELKANDEVEYWLEARDACDQPRAGVTLSQPRHKIKISATRVDPKKAEEQRRQADKARAEHETSQDQQRQKEDQEREKARQESKDGKTGKEKGKSGGGPGEGKEKGKEQPGKDGEKQSAKDRETADRAEQMKKELDRQEGKSGESGGSEGKGEKGPAAGSSREDGKGGEDKQPGQSKGESNQGGKPGENKGGQSKAGGNPADRKEAGQGKEGAGKDAGAGRETGPPDASKSGEAKPGQGTGGEPKAEKGTGKQGNASSGATAGAGKGSPDKAAEGGKAGQSKPGPGKPDDKGRPGEGKPAGEATGKKPQDATVSDVREQAAGLKSTNEATRDQAARALEQISRQAKDAQSREEARKELEKSGNSWAMPATSKPGTSEAGSPDRGEAKPGSDKGEGSAGSAKPAGPGAQPEQAGKGKEGAGGEGTGGGPTGGGGPPPALARDRGDGTTSNNPGDGLPGPRTPGTSGGGIEKKARPSRPGEHRASVLQLEDFRKRVTPEMLRDLKMSPADFERFLKDYEDLARRQQASGEPEKLTTRPGSGTLRNTGGRTIEPTSPGSLDRSSSEGRANPLPEYRDPQAEFQKLLSRPDRP